MNDMAHLPEAIGQMALLEFGRETVEAIRVTVDPREYTASVEVVPRMRTYEEALRIMGVAVELQRVFDEDVAVTVFVVDSIAAASPAPSRELTYAA